MSKNKFIAITLATAIQITGLAFGSGVPASIPWAIEEDACIPEISRCVWDAEHRGNGDGASYLMVRTADGTFTPQYISHHYAHRVAMAFCNRPDVSCNPEKEGYYDE